MPVAVGATPTAIVDAVALVERADAVKTVEKAGRERPAIEAARGALDAHPASPPTARVPPSLR